jgi:hypothetical protein
VHTFIACNIYGQTEQVLIDLLPFITQNSYDSNYPTSDSLYKANNLPKTQLDSIYYHSLDEWDYLQKRGFVIADSLIKLYPGHKKELESKMSFKDERITGLFNDFLTICDSTVGFEYKSIIDNKKYYTVDSFVSKYGRRVQNGVIVFSPIVFSESKYFACFVYTAYWQGHDFSKFVVAVRSFEKWNVYELRSIREM